MSDFKTPYKKVKGLGSAKGGTDHWWMMRLTSVALIPLGIWFVFSLVGLVDVDLTEFADWLRSPFETTMMVLFIVFLFHHAANGMQVVYEDYIHCEKMKWFAIYGTKFACLFMAVASVVAVIRISFGGM